MNEENINELIERAEERRLKTLRREEDVRETKREHMQS